MRRSREATVAELRDFFLEGKSEAYKEKFAQKNLDQQYAAIANWKKSAKDLGGATKNLAKVTAATVVTHLKDAKKKLEKLDELTPKEAKKIQGLLDSVKDSIDNFAKIKDQQLLNTLKAKKVELAKENESLDRQIEELESKLS